MEADGRTKTNKTTTIAKQQQQKAKPTKKTQQHKY